ncbi:acyltransferase family protein [Primorskyibacter sp. S87]|uniref:acyltransferase family protein n=1 Tax=Primorskyibacter sp. S87 TaxID=3415126 RepID=UPI003C7978C8
MPKLEGLQLLRALAALMVLIGHVIAEAEHYFGIALAPGNLPWTRGVDIFFVISGFIITLSAARYRRRPVAFLQRRMLRVVPLYYLFTTLMVATLILAPDATKDTQLEVGQVLSSYLFLPFERHDGRIAPVLSLGWTLNYEVFFYALMATCLALGRPILAISVTICGLSVLSLLSFEATAPKFWTNPLILEFLYGVLLARLWRQGHRYPSAPLAAFSGALALGLMVTLHDTDLPRFLAVGLPSALLVAAGTIFCPPRPLPMQLIGDASFALYLSHRFTLRLLTLTLLPMLPPNAAWLYVAVACVLSLLIGLLCHLLLERPLARQVVRSADA